MPIVIPSVNEGNRRVGQFLHGRVVQGGNADAIESAPSGGIADSERTHAAVPAKEMALILWLKLILGQLGFSGQQAE
jgi:hypothetical protein